MRQIAAPEKSSSQENTPPSRPCKVLRRAIAGPHEGAGRRGTAPRRKVAVGNIPTKGTACNPTSMSSISKPSVRPPEGRGRHAPHRALNGHGFSRHSEGALACISDLPVADGRPADTWMLSLEPFSSDNAGPTLSLLRLVQRAPMACRTKDCVASVVHLLVRPHREHRCCNLPGQAEPRQRRLDPGLQHALVVCV